MTRFLPLLIGVTAVVASAFDSGRQTGRWGLSTDLKDAADRVHQVPETFGQWHSVPQELNARQLKVAGVVSYFSRYYTNQSTGSKIQVLLICGRPGPISVHEPDVCYGAAGYVRVGELARTKVGDSEFKVGKFIKGPPQPDALHILWAWATDDGELKAPDNPRATFGRATGALYKLYVIRQQEPGDQDAAQDPAAEFLTDFLPELKHCLATTH